MFGTLIIPQNSAVYGSRGLMSGDVILKMNDCTVNTMKDWAKCVQASISEENSGFCLPIEQVKQQDISIKGLT